MNKKHKHYDAIIAFANGIPIQWKYPGSSEWRDWHNCLSFSENYDYRKKPIIVDKWIWVYSYNDCGCIKYNVVNSLMSEGEANLRFKHILNYEKIDFTKTAIEE